LTTKKMLIEVELVPVMTSIIAEPGDKLMMLNGICIGVDTSREMTAAPPTQPRRLIEPPPQKQARKQPLKLIEDKQQPDSISFKMREYARAHLTDKPQKTGILFAGCPDYKNTIGTYVMRYLVREGVAARVGYGLWTRAAKSAPPLHKSMPYKDKRVVSFRELEGMGVSHTRAHIGNLMKEGKFPKSLDLGARRKAWRTADIEAWKANHS